MTVVVSGASGFIGRTLMQRLGAGARGLSLRDNNHNGWAQALQQVDCVVHLAARVHVMHDQYPDPLATYRAVNTDLTLQFAQCAAQAGVRRFVFLSSVKVLGESSVRGRALRESDLPAPQDPYGQSKWEAEQALLQLGHATGMQVVIIRPPLVYGPGVKANFASLIRWVRWGIPLPLAALDNRRSLVALDNLVDFIQCCVTHPAATGGTFLVSDGDDVSTPELIRRIAAAQNRTAHLFFIPLRILWLMARISGKSAALERLCGDLQVDISKARTVLGWEPPVRMQDCLRKTIGTPLS